MATQMTLHWSPRSPYVRKVMIAAHEMGLQDRLRPVRTVVGGTTPHRELMRINPLGKIPTLELGDGSALYDSPVICEYLDGLDGAPKLFPRSGKARMTALRRQALGDGFLEMMVLLRDERMRETLSDRHIASTAVRKAAILDSLEREAEALTRTPFGIGHIAIGCALSYLDFRFGDEDWRRGHLHIANWHAAFAARPSVRATLPVDDT